MISFPDWFKELCANYVWYEPAIQHHEPETFKGAANKVYMQYVASEIFPPVQEARKHVYNVLCKIPPDKKVKVDWTKKALQDLEQKKDDWRPASPENVDKYVAEIQKIIAESPMMNSRPKMSYKEIADKGDILPPKDKPWPVTTPEEAYVRDRHFEWIKNNFEARTGQKLPSWISEEDWNIIYDDQHLNGKGL